MFITLLFGVAYFSGNFGFFCLNKILMEFNETYFPGSVSLLDQLDKKMLVILRDGKTLIGYLRYESSF